jgi:serine/threonine protein kinase
MREEYDYVMEHVEAANPSEHRSIKDIFKLANPDLLDLLTQMLELNPNLRPSASQLLKHKVFDSIRNEKQENCHPPRVTIPCDENEYKHDYERDTDHKDALSHILDQIRQEASIKNLH